MLRSYQHLNLRTWDKISSKCRINERNVNDLAAAAAAAKLLQSCTTLCDPIDGSPPGFPIPGILQARTLEWVAISFSSAWKWKVKVKSLSRVQLLATPWTMAYKAPLSMGFSRQEHWSWLPLPSLSDKYLIASTKHLITMILVMGFIDNQPFFFLIEG